MGKAQRPSGMSQGGSGESVSLHAQRLRRVEEAFRTLPSRYRGAEPDFDATFQVRLGDVGRTWQVRAHAERCEVRPSSTREPDVVIGTDAATWIALREGRLSGLDAFAQRRLYARGDLDLALAFEGLFRLPGDRPPLLRVTDVKVPGATIRSLISGEGREHAICLHGLGSHKASFFATVSALAPDYTVHAIDLPGFGGSSKSARAPYDAAYFARAVLGYMDASGLDRASRSRWRWRSRTGCRAPRSSAPPWRSASDAPWSPWSGWSAPRSPRSRIRSGRLRCAPSSGACSLGPTGSTPPRPTLPPTSSAARTGRARPESRSSPPFATSTSTHPTASAASGRVWENCARRRSSCGARAIGSCPRRSHGTSPRRCHGRTR
ncbi:MAG: hypothetical protein E6G49_02505 [Actinobacteria bacterium]|nr:MAG: hypothetical protein E6G49_02505 [Actinomycetota bacterium]